MQRSTDELEEFRRQWKAEVEIKKHVEHASVEVPANTDSSQKNEHSAEATRNSSTTGLVQHVTEPESSETQIEEEAVEKKSAMDYYMIAVDKERQGNLGQALANYRRAFKMDRNIDYKYKQHYQTHIAPSITAEATTNIPSQTLSGLEESENDNFHHVVQFGREYVAPNTSHSPIDDLVEDFKNQSLEYIPADEEKPVLISILPNEVVVHVLRNVVFDSVRSVHNFALVCKRFLLLTRAQSIWRPLCEHVYHTHNIPKEISDQFQLDIVNRAYNGNWLRMFIERPRIRFEGIYIATCHYLRPGISDTAWNQPIHLVTYYRYLRFFPDGTIVKYLSTDEPVHVVRNITKHFKAKQVFHGRYEIEGDKVIVHMRDQETRPTERFQMNVNIKSTHRGRHNKLAWEEYVSWSDVRGDKTNYNLKHMKPYYFSVVRSYIVE
ncbi:hypothetical protein K450DRAFT_239690 [Umbelopsis ramanniana AG]|uniref:F-box domain-containing protein n=1 Tax=Umbelopsis ramanniana AG TaxID=1314678 RepID=A0AAD5EAI7_UMBRA|nr:uncharacterized protein K450DRAFT_239690 [Umbelopsis ramanniana AG]KAI8579909.1 hypothetical protein K450DRAFT_239690 [Umbelopsis ramanniana AG]